MKNINLGKKLPSPEPATAPSQISSAHKPETHYPSLHIEADGEPFKNMPESGVTVIHHKIKSRSVHTDAKGKKTSTLQLEVHKMVSSKPHKEKSGGEALDDLAKEEAGEGC
jgi:hypothetical protein